MAVCQKCHKQLKDGTKFCDNCGTEIVKTDSFQNCENELNEKFAHNQKLKKIILFGCVGVLLIIAIVVSVLLLFNKNANKSEDSATNNNNHTDTLESPKIDELENNNFTLYVKDKEIYFTDLSKNDHQQVTSNLFGNTDVSDGRLSEFSETYNYLCTISKDGKTLFYIDKINEDDYGFALYYKSTDNIVDQEAIKIDSDVTCYCVNNETTIVTYLKSSDNILYQYDIKTEEKEKIDSIDGIYHFAISDDGNKMIYMNNEGSIYIKYFGSEKEKIDIDVSNLLFISDDLSTIFYQKDDSLYKKEDEKDKTKIASDIFNTIRIYETGEVYYLKTNSNKFTYSDFVQDDLAEYDSHITEPGEPDYPNWQDYDSYAQYKDAYETYEESYNYAYNMFLQKNARDEIRNELQSLELSTFSLYYYNGVEEKSISDSISLYSISYNQYSSTTPIIAFSYYNYDNYNKIKLSELEANRDEDIISFEVENAINSCLEPYIAIGDTSTPIEQDSATNFVFDNNGKTIYYIADIPEYKEHGNLYKISIENGEAGSAELYDSDVYMDLVDFIADGQLMYFKDYKENNGDLHINKKRIDYDVKCSSVKYNEKLNRIVYFIDWNDEKSYGILKIHENDQSSKIGDEVHAFDVYSNGDILYLYNYSHVNGKGDLYMYQNNENTKIDIDVSTIISNLYGGIELAATTNFFFGHL